MDNGLGVLPKLEKRTLLEIGLFGCPKCLSAHLALFGHVLTNKGRNRRCRFLGGHTFAVMMAFTIPDKN